MGERLELEKAVGLALQDLRGRRALTQDALAAAAGLDRTTISLIERGANNPSIRIIFKLAAALNVRPSELLALVEVKLTADEKSARPAPRP